jgi:hypothetical protein
MVANTKGRDEPTTVGKDRSCQRIEPFGARKILKSTVNLAKISIQYTAHAVSAGRIRV